jgi:hypothetical protein
MHVLTLGKEVVAIRIYIVIYQQKYIAACQSLYFSVPCVSQNKIIY